MTDITPHHALHTWLSTASAAVEDREPSEMWEREEVLRRAVDRVVTAVNDRVVCSPDEPVSHLVELLSYPAARIIVTLIDDRKMTKRYSRGEAKSARNLISEGEVVSIDDAFSDFGVDIDQVPPTDSLARSATAEWMVSAPRDDLITVLVSQTYLDEKESQRVADAVRDSGTDEAFDLMVDHPASPLALDTLAIPVADFARMAATVDDLALVHQDVEDGLVILHDETDAYRLIEEAIYNRVDEDLPLDVPDEVADHFEDAVDLAELRIDDDAFEVEIDRVDEGLFPPVMKKLIADIQNGVPLTHEERFAIGSFLAAVGMSDDDIVDLFELSSGYAEDETRYQLNHIRTRGDGGESYTPPSYSTIESWGIEWEKDALEEKVKHPLQYYRIKLKDTDESNKRVPGDA